MQRFALLISTALVASCGTTDEPMGPTQCVNVSGVANVDGLEIPLPTAEPVACEVVPNTAGATPENVCQAKSAPDLSCVGQTIAAGTPAMVTMRGCVASFGIGADSFGLSVTVLAERQGGAPVDPGYDIAGTPGAQTENTPSAVFGNTVSTQVDETECEDRGFYEIAGVPTETSLIVRITHQNEDAGRRGYVDTYKYNVQIRNHEVVDVLGAAVADTSACTPATCFVDEETNTISEATFRTIPRAAGVSVITGENDLYDGVGQGHVAGEVQDCTSEDTVQNAVVKVDADARKLAYFNVDFPPDRDNIDDPKPEGTRTRTNADGLYSVLGIDTATGGQPVKVGAIVLPSICGADGICRCNDDGTENPMWSAADAGEAEAMSLGTRTVFVFPDSITIMTFDQTLYTAE